MSKQMLDLRNPQDFAFFNMHSADGQYISVCDTILREGTLEWDAARTDDQWQTIIGVGMQLVNTLIAFPALLSARKNWVAAVDEMCWMARGETNIKTLGSKIWDEWADENGECGPIYGEMWRRWPDVKAFFDEAGALPALWSPDHIRNQAEISRMREDGYLETPMSDGRILFEGQIDQFANALEHIMARSRSRRIRVQGFNPSYVNMQGLPPCHTEFEFNVTQATDYETAQMNWRGFAPQKDSLHITVQLRSNDCLLGRPFNIMGYSAMHQLIAKWAGLNVGSFTLNSTNTHIYTHHVEAYKKQREQYVELETQMKETGNPIQYPLLEISDEVLGLTAKELLDNVNIDWFQLLDYSPKPAVRGRVTK